MARKSAEGIFWEACTNGDLETARMLINDPNVNVNHRDAELLRSPFYRCAGHNRKEVFDLLHKHPRIDVTIRTKQGTTPFYIACQKNCVEIARALIRDPRTDINATTNEHCTAFYVSCSHNNIAIVDLLLADPRVNINIPAADGCTPLFYVVYNGNEAVVKRILASTKKVDLDILWQCNKYNALQQAVAFKRENLVKLLTEYMEDIEGTRSYLRRELNLPDPLSGAKLFSLVVLLSDGYLKKRANANQSICPIRFFKIAQQLPIELQMKICNLQSRVVDWNIPSTIFLDGIKRVLKLDFGTQNATLKKHFAKFKGRMMLGKRFGISQKI